MNLRNKIATGIGAAGLACMVGGAFLDGINDNQDYTMYGIGLGALGVIAASVLYRKEDDIEANLNVGFRPYGEQQETRDRAVKKIDEEYHNNN